MDRNTASQVQAEWADISIPMRNGMVNWPGDPTFEISNVRKIEKGDNATVSRMIMGSHSGTHMDAPRHFIRNGADISSMPLDATVGVARVIEIFDTHSIKPDELVQHGIRLGERILFKTMNSLKVWKANAFVQDFVYISNEAADYLSGLKLKMVGVDYLSVGPYQGDGTYVHRTLLGNGVWLVEGLDLSRVNPGNYEFICLPLRIDGGDGAPARAILRPVSR